MTGRRRAALGMVLLLFVLLLWWKGEPPRPERVVSPPRWPEAPKGAPTRKSTPVPRLFGTRPADPAPHAASPEPIPDSRASRPAELAFSVEADESGDPLPEAVVEVVSSCLPPGAPPPRVRGANGDFVVTGLVPGGAVLRVSAPGRAARLADATLGEGKNGLTPILLFRSGTVAGVLLDREGVPITGVTIHARASHRDLPVEAEVDEEGRFRLEGLPAGPVQLMHSGSPDDMIVVAVEADRVVESAWGGAARITGHAFDAEGAPADLVAAFPLAALPDPLGSYRALEEGEVPGTRTTEVDREDGSFSFGGLPPGEWWVGNEHAHAVVAVKDAAGDPVRVDLRPWFVNGRLLGTSVESAALLAIPEGSLEPALRGDRVRLLEVLAAFWSAERADDPAVDEAGAFSLPVPGPGRYAIFPRRDGVSLESPVLVAAAERPGPGTAEATLRPAATLRFTLPEGISEEFLLVAARNEKGAVVSLAAGGRTGILSLPAQRFRIRAQGGEGRIYEADFLPPEVGEGEIVLVPK